MNAPYQHQCPGYQPGLGQKAAIANIQHGQQVRLILGPHAPDKSGSGAQECRYKNTEQSVFHLRA